MQRSTTSPQVNRGSSTSSSVQRSTTSPQVNRGSGTSSSVQRSTTSPQVNRGSSTSSSVQRSTTSPQVNRGSGTSSSVQRSTTSPQVNRGSSTSSSVQRSTTSPQVNRGSGTSSSSVQRSTTSPQVIRGSSTSSSTSTKTGSSVSSANSRRDNSQMVGTDLRGTATARDRISTTTQGVSSSKDRIGTGSKPGGNGGKPGGNGNVDKDKNGKDRHNTKPGGNGRRDGHDRPNGYGGNGNHYDYSNHHYHNDFHNNYSHHSWSWSRPLPPPTRPYRPVIYEWYRPVIPYGWAPYSGAPVIDRILGLTFGSLFDTSIEYLYYNGYEIDGYADHIIYLRNVLLLSHLWDDVMLSFDSGNRLVNAQFVYHSSSYDKYRYRRIYNNLTRVYGAPITSDSRGISWYGGGCTGWITLSTNIDLGHHYMTLSIGY